jgi:hypothetical protein
MRVFLCLILTLGAPIVSAHDQHDKSIKIVQLYKYTDMYAKALVENTHAGSRIRCALYDESGQVLGVKEGRTKEFATELTFDHTGFDLDAVTSYRCIKVD